MGIAHNVFEKMEREKDRKERMKKYEEWQKVRNLSENCSRLTLISAKNYFQEKVKKQQKIKDMQTRVKEAERRLDFEAVDNLAEGERGAIDDSLDEEPSTLARLGASEEVAEDEGGNGEVNNGGRNSLQRQKSSTSSTRRKNPEEEGPKSACCGSCVIV